MTLSGSNFVTAYEIPMSETHSVVMFWKIARKKGTLDSVECQCQLGAKTFQKFTQNFSLLQLSSKNRN